MKTKIYFVLLLLPLLIFISCNDSENPVEVVNTQSTTLNKVTESGNVIPGQYIVVFNNDVTRVPEVANEKAKLHAATIGHIYQHSIKGFSAKMSPQAAAKLAKDPNVKSVTQDRVITYIPPVKVTKKPTRPPKPDPEPTGEVTPWGITRVGGASSGIGTTVWVIDTGVDLDNPDLNVDVARSITYVRSKSADDDNGHGTHVAGTIAAIEGNNLGVVGVAAGATVVAVKVLDRRGSGTLSGVIAGIEYVATNADPGDVANMSLGGGVSVALDAAVLAAAAESGVKFSLAAGNESNDANYHSPAGVNGPNIYTVSAMDENDNWAYFSNYGNPPVDFCAPGYLIESLKKGGGTVVYSGTSMAAPHVAGLLLLLGEGEEISTDGTVNGDPDGNPDPIAHK